MFEYPLILGTVDAPTCAMCGSVSFTVKYTSPLLFDCEECGRRSRGPGVLERSQAAYARQIEDAHAKAYPLVKEEREPPWPR